MNAQLRAPALVERHFIAMGTPVLVAIMAEPARRAAAESAVAEIEKLLVEFGRDGWAWGAGTLGQFNRALGRGMAAQVPYLLRPLFERAWEIRQASGGLFEPRLGALVRLWGFDDPSRTRSEPPAPAEIDDALQMLREAPHYHGQEWYGPAPGVAWDLGAIGKGYIVDLALDWLRRRGFDHTIVNAGGNVAARGRRATRAWRVGIRDPRGSGELPSLLAALDVGDESVITHGDDQRYFEHGGRRYSHVLHPRSGTPASSLRALTVVHADGTLADAGGAALFVAGADGWPRLARRLDIDKVLVITAQGEIRATPALAARLQPQPGVRIEQFY